MLCRKTLCVVLLAAPFAFPAEKQRNWEHAKVIAQNVNSSAAGAYAAPLGTGAVAVPIYRRSNIVVVETDTYRYEWSEVGRTPVILPVNGFIDFYRDGKWFVVLDAKQKKHKFGLIGMVAKGQNDSATVDCDSEGKNCRGH
jgi:hypothetical protein